MRPFFNKSLFKGIGVRGMLTIIRPYSYFYNQDTVQNYLKMGMVNSTKVNKYFIPKRGKV